MAFTLIQLEALDAAIASGKRSYTHSYQDRSVTETFHSLEEMITLRALMKAELGASTAGNSTLASFRRDNAGTASTRFIDTDA